jgi:tetratricopeptide (TPR) repeat protein
MELPDVQLQLGYARLRNRQLDEARSAAERAIAGLPAQAHELQARVALARGHLAEAATEAQAAASGRNPQPASLLIGAEVSVARGDLDGALARVGEAERRASAAGVDSVRNLEAVRGDALARLGRFREAEEAYRRELAGFPGNLVAQASLAALLFAEHRRDDAVAVLQAMIAANPGPRARHVAAATLQAVGAGAGAEPPGKRAPGRQAPGP